MLKHGVTGPSSCDWDVDKPGSESKQHNSRAGAPTSMQGPLSKGKGSVGSAQKLPKLSSHSQGPLPFSSLSPSASASHQLLPARDRVAAGSQGLGPRAAAVLHTWSQISVQRTLQVSSRQSSHTFQATLQFQYIHLVLLNPALPRVIYARHLPALERDTAFHYFPTTERGHGRQSLRRAAS